MPYRIKKPLLGYSEGHVVGRSLLYGAVLRRESTITFPGPVHTAQSDHLQWIQRLFVALIRVGKWNGHSPVVNIFLATAREAIARCIALYIVTLREAVPRESLHTKLPHSEKKT